mmetsp:Transcript_51944/g.111081  ORF Transcript_51944/g.111081 Transcript_51944/m.111081 type:complete len:255 (+) Transcript_51944:243-1007(+)
MLRAKSSCQRHPLWWHGRSWTCRHLPTPAPLRMKSPANGATDVLAWGQGVTRKNKTCRQHNHLTRLQQQASAQRQVALQRYGLHHWRQAAHSPHEPERPLQADMLLLRLSSKLVESRKLSPRLPPLRRPRGAAASCGVIPVTAVVAATRRCGYSPATLAPLLQPRQPPRPPQQQQLQLQRTRVEQHLRLRHWQPHARAPPPAPGVPAWRALWARHRASWKAWGRGHADRGASPPGHAAGGLRRDPGAPASPRRR